ncbi:hypothetical protein [Bradyrhizobium sp. STM 3557]|uniref:hypothetical protein n=1 Tax=Bradyrhizobium sp. STM 3557 TaxID=578920 RepID=UPI003890A3E9
MDFISASESMGCGDIAGLQKLPGGVTVCKFFAAVQDEDAGDACSTSVSSRRTHVGTLSTTMFFPSLPVEDLMVRSALARVSNLEAQTARAILRDAA